MDGPANCPAQLPGRAGAGHTGHRPTPANARRHCGGRGWRRWRRWWRWWRGRWRWRRGWRRRRSGDASRGGGDVRRRMGGGGLETKVAKVGPSPASGRGTQAGSNLLKSDRRWRLTKRSSLHKKRSSLRGRTKVAKLGPLRARVKSARSPTDPLRLGPPGEQSGTRKEGVLRSLGKAVHQPLPPAHAPALCLWNEDDVIG
jgi:hypothetical protein